MLMKVLMQIVALIMSMACTGQAFKANATKFDKIAFPIIGFAFLICCAAIQGVQ